MKKKEDEEEEEEEKEKEGEREEKEEEEEEENYLKFNGLADNSFQLGYFCDILTQRETLAKPEPFIHSLSSDLILLREKKI